MQLLVLMPVVRLTPGHLNIMEAASLAIQYSILLALRKLCGTIWIAQDPEKMQ